eukprot:9451583-Alexandrium_andersonii.AAC.1
MAINELGVHCVGEDIRWFLLAKPLEQLKVPGPDTLLHPELPAGQVSDAPGSSAPAKANCRATVGAHLQGGAEAKVMGNGKSPWPSAAPFTMPARSASPELSATVFWVVGQCLIAR